MVEPGIVAVSRTRSDGLVMRRVIVIAATGLSLAGCSSFSLDVFKPTPPTVQLQLQSTPPGADARTSLGPGCKTPCTVSITVPDNGFSVTYSMIKFQTATIPVQVIRNPGDFTTASTTTLDPNPVVAELQPLGPPPRPERKMMRPKKPKKPKGAPPPDAGSPFPEPGQAPPPAAAPPPAPSR
jgi:hypothetical protein